MHVTYKEISPDHRRNFRPERWRFLCGSFESVAAGACKPRCSVVVYVEGSDKISQLRQFYLRLTPGSSEPSARISLPNPSQKRNKRIN